MPGTRVYYRKQEDTYGYVSHIPKPEQQSEYGVYFNDECKLVPRELRNQIWSFSSAAKRLHPRKTEQNGWLAFYTKESDGSWRSLKDWKAKGQIELLLNAVDSENERNVMENQRRNVMENQQRNVMEQVRGGEIEAAETPQPLRIKILRGPNNSFTIDKGDTFSMPPKPKDVTTSAKVPCVQIPGTSNDKFNAAILVAAIQVFFQFATERVVVYNSCDSCDSCNISTPSPYIQLFRDICGQLGAKQVLLTLHLKCPQFLSFLQQSLLGSWIVHSYELDRVYVDLAVTVDLRTTLQIAEFAQCYNCSQQLLYNALYFYCLVT